jgi:hypothetical protein
MLSSLHCTVSSDTPKRVAGEQMEPRQAVRTSSSGMSRSASKMFLSRSNGSSPPGGADRLRSAVDPLVRAFEGPADSVAELVGQREAPARRTRLRGVDDASLGEVEEAAEPVELRLLDMYAEQVVGDLGHGHRQLGPLEVCVVERAQLVRARLRYGSVAVVSGEPLLGSCPMLPGCGATRNTPDGGYGPSGGPS